MNSFRRAPTSTLIDRQVCQTGMQGELEVQQGFQEPLELTVSLCPFAQYATVFLQYPSVQPSKYIMYYSDLATPSVPPHILKKRPFQVFIPATGVRNPQGTPLFSSINTINYNTFLDILKIAKAKNRVLCHTCAIPDYSRHKKKEPNGPTFLFHSTKNSHGI